MILPLSVSKGPTYVLAGAGLQNFVLLKNLHPKFCQIRKKKRSNFIYPF
jgi:hypothetical protein